MCLGVSAQGVRGGPARCRLRVELGGQLGAGAEHRLPRTTRAILLKVLESTKPQVHYLQNGNNKFPPLVKCVEGKKGDHVCGEWPSVRDPKGIKVGYCSWRLGVTDRPRCVTLLHTATWPGTSSWCFLTRPTGQSSTLPRAAPRAARGTPGRSPRTRYVVQKCPFPFGCSNLNMFEVASTIHAIYSTAGGKLRPVENSAKSLMKQSISSNAVEKSNPKRAAKICYIFEEHT